jgi:hypothetical protein
MPIYKNNSRLLLRNDFSPFWNPTEWICLQTVQKGPLLACEIECQHNIFTVNGLSLKIVQESFVRNNLSTEKFSSKILRNWAQRKHFEVFLTSVRFFLVRDIYF